MHTYQNPYQSALSEFNEKYLILSFATLLSTLGIAILLKMKNYYDAFNVYLLVSTITIILCIPYWFLICLKKIRTFTINISDSISICDKYIPVSEIKEVYTTVNKDLVIISNNEIYRIYKTISNYDDLLFRLKQIICITEKSEAKNKTIYAINLFLFVIYLLINIPSIVIPVGIYLIFSYIQGICKTKKNIFVVLFANLFMILFVSYKLYLYIKFLF